MESQSESEKKYQQIKLEKIELDRAFNSGEIGSLQYNIELNSIQERAIDVLNNGR